MLRGSVAHDPCLDSNSVPTVSLGKAWLRPYGAAETPEICVVRGHHKSWRVRCADGDLVEAVGCHGIRRR
jgi:hypothetical protein